VNPKISEHNGRIFKLTGDGILIEFPSVVSAVACAVRYPISYAHTQCHRAGLRASNFASASTSEISSSEDGDIFGDGVNVAARLESIAPIGGIAVSQSVRDHVGKTS